MQPSLDVIWQYTYSTEAAVGLRERNQRILAVGGGPVGLFLSLAPDGTGEGPCITRAASHLTVSDVSPDVITPTYALDSGRLQIVDVAVTTTETPASLICPRFLHLPLVLPETG